ncbi:MAG: sigma-70 family RNA polymerase sigma factor [Tepidisphaeraceae bacterium]|jgi:RNA polymerase sigma-70 factor (ECF subfamily)
MREIERLYRSHGAALLAYLRRAFAWCAVPEDLLQETFVQALRRQDRLADAVSPRAWLFGIARHVGLTAARRHHPAAPLEQDQTAAELDPNIAAMREAIATLPQILRETLELRLRAGLSYEEIAEALDIPIGTVRSRLHSALMRLRESLGSDSEK